MLVRRHACYKRLLQSWHWSAASHNQNAVIRMWLQSLTSKQAPVGVDWLWLSLQVGAGGNAGNQSAIKVIRGLVSCLVGH